MTQNQRDTAALLKVDKLGVKFYTPKGTVHAVRETSFEVHRGEVLGLVGESGCGKSTVAFAIMGYLPEATQVDGFLMFEGRDIAHLTASELQRLRGNRIAMVYQDPAASLNPSMRVGPQVEEVLAEHLLLSAAQARQRVRELFESVNLPDVAYVMRRYPHELSGGMQQRVMIAMALACEPDLLIMDEPTTGLDVTTAAVILDLVTELKQRVNAGILYITHDLAVIARIADRVAVMYAGQIAEEAPVGGLFRNPQHPYTSGLLSCVPKPPTEETPLHTLSSIPGTVYSAGLATQEACLFASRCPLAQERCRTDAPPLMTTGKGRLTRCFFWQEVTPRSWGQSEMKEESRGEAEPLLVAPKLRRFYGQWQRKYFLFGPRVRPPVRALVDVDFMVKTGLTLGIVGESGCGKSTAARIIVGLMSPDRGQVLLEGRPLPSMVEARTREQQAAMSMVFQNPASSLNPKVPVRSAILRSLRNFAGLSRESAKKRAVELFKAVGLNPSYLDRLPGELSGGEQQRVALAIALAGNPRLIVLDEPVSSLDVSVQAQVLELLEKHQRESKISYMFISHDLSVVRYVSDSILVLYAGHVAEVGPARSVLEPPWHPYTEALISAVPVPDPYAEASLIRLEGPVPTARQKFTGCFFASRCPRKIGPICDKQPPPTQKGPDSPEHAIYCHIPVKELQEMQDPQSPFA